MKTGQVLTEKMLTEWTGLTGQELSIFYLEYKKQSSSNVLPYDIEYIKQDILKFKELYECPLSEKVRIEPPMSEIFKNINVKNLINLWESKVKI
jgi:hypothetical protein